MCGEKKILFDLALMQYIVFFKSFSRLGASLSYVSHILNIYPN